MMTGFSGLGKLTKHYRSNLFHGLIFSFFKLNQTFILKGCRKELSVSLFMHSKKMLGCFKPNLDQIWTNPIVGLKITF